MTNLYVVMGATGEYSDHHEWVIAAYDDELLAQRHIELATHWDRQHRDEWKSLAYEKRDAFVLTEVVGAYSCDYSGVIFYYMTVPMRDRLPDWP